MNFYVPDFWLNGE